jgi:proteasome assembly chaperone (PAC2) family protein
MEELARSLERQNESLKRRADELEELVMKLKEALLEAVVKTDNVSVKPDGDT